ncbi:Uncharacterised protein [Bordetella pertussis]|nr:Uncharacterised protein [Bordetella pertussis]
MNCRKCRKGPFWVVGGVMMMSQVLRLGSWPRRAVGYCC